MSKIKLSSLLLYSALLLLIFTPTPSYASTKQTIYVELSQFKFEPGRIIVNKGDTVIIKLKSVDVTHGFYVDGYDVNLIIMPGEVVTVTIIADKAGKFKIRCSVICGPLHPFMVGDFIVTDDGLNIPYLLSILILFLIGLIPFLRIREGI
jgi:heme/copper-type cytochrome/quinol oxidase subunit 2